MCFVIGSQSVSPELTEAFDTVISALAVQSQAGKEAVEHAGGTELMRLKSSVIIMCLVSKIEVG